MLKKMFSSRRGIIRLIAVLAIVLCFIGTYLVPRVYGFEGDFFYPIVFFYSTPLIYVVTLSSFAVILWDFPLFRTGYAVTERVSKTVALTFIMIPCACSILCFQTFYSGVTSYAPLPAHFERISFENHIYYLAWDNHFSDIMDESRNDTYLVYRCDSLGMMCYYNPSTNIPYRRWGGTMEERTAGFVVDDNRLYVQINETRVPVATRGG